MNNSRTTKIKSDQLKEKRTRMKENALINSRKEKTLSELKKKGRCGSRINNFKTKTWLEAELT